MFLTIESQNAHYAVPKALYCMKLDANNTLICGNDSETLKFKIMYYNEWSNHAFCDGVYRRFNIPPREMKPHIRITNTLKLTNISIQETGITIIKINNKLTLIHLNNPDMPQITDFICEDCKEDNIEDWEILDGVAKRIQKTIWCRPLTIYLNKITWCDDDGRYKYEKSPQIHQADNLISRYIAQLSWTMKT